MRNMRKLVTGLLLTIGAVKAQNAVKHPKSIALSYQPLSSSGSSSPLAVVEYDPKSLEYVLASWTPPSVDFLQSNSQEPQSRPLIRVLLPNGGATVTSLGAFDTNLSQNIDIWISQETGEPISASIGSVTPPPLSKEEEELRQKEERLRKRGKPVPPRAPKPKSKSKKVQEAVVGEVQAGPVVKVNLLVAGQGPQPKLISRAPPQLDAEGREVVVEEVPEKSFIQKYWFIGMALVFVLMTAGGGGDK